MKNALFDIASAWRRGRRGQSDRGTKGKVVKSWDNIIMMMMIMMNNSPIVGPHMKTLFCISHCWWLLGRLFNLPSHTGRLSSWSSATGTWGSERLMSLPKSHSCQMSEPRFTPEVWMTSFVHFPRPHVAVGSKDIVRCLIVRAKHAEVSATVWEAPHEGRVGWSPKNTWF